MILKTRVSVLKICVWCMMMYISGLIYIHIWSYLLCVGHFFTELLQQNLSDLAPTDLPAGDLAKKRCFRTTAPITKKNWHTTDLGKGAKPPRRSQNWVPKAGQKIFHQPGNPQTAKYLFGPNESKEYFEALAAPRKKTQLSSYITVKSKWSDHNAKHGCT